jgi:EAL domain-containing protein (putative c-di-GMP-specific phosphodiesterase class I)
VETQAQFAALEALGCDQYQGYYFSKALPPEEFEQLLRAQQAGAPPQWPQDSEIRVAGAVAR